LRKKTIPSPLELKQDSEKYTQHAIFIKEIGDILLENEGKTYQIDEHNEKILRFLLLYFNGSKDCEQIFPKMKHKVNKNIILIGKPGTGKSMIMQIFSEYLKRSRSPLYFRNVGGTEVLNYQKMHGHINMYTYNMTDSKTIEGKPFHICINDIGNSGEKQKSYGTDLESVIDELLYARYEIWTNKGIRYHITTNLDSKDFKEKFDGRLIDRMKAFNTLVLEGESRR
jgi:hypothetical protein